MRRFRRSAGIAALALLSATLGPGCSGREATPWLDVRLTGEFSADQADEVRSFEDYLALEDRLYAELDEKVYAVTPPADPDTELLRYRSGSASDPRGWQPNWNRSFELTVPTPVGGVLLLHGMSDSPYSLRVLGETLNREGYQVVGLRLPGNGTAPSGLKYFRWEDMAAAVRMAAAHLAAEVGGKPVHIVGYSIGGALALNYALDTLDGQAAPVPASLVLISPAVGVHSAAALAAWKRRLSMLPGLGRLAWLNIEPEFDPYKYNSFATRAGEQSHLLTRSVARRVAARAEAGTLGEFPPTLVFKSNADSTVTNQAAADLLGRLDPNRNELVLFDVNRLAAKSVLRIADPRALANTLVGDAGLPFTVTLVTNESPDSLAVVARRQPPFSGQFSATEPLGMSWPPSVISLSHVALPIAPDDPLYGQRPPDNTRSLYLGQMAIQGERGFFALSSDWLLRMRYNPFYAFLQATAVEWVKKSGATPGQIIPADSSSRAGGGDGRPQ